MNKIFKLALCCMIFFNNTNAFSENIESSLTPVSKFSQPAVNVESEQLAETPKIENSFIKIRPEENQIESLKSTDTQKFLKIEESPLEKPKKEPDVVKLQVEENIFNKSFEKKFETGIFKDVKLIGAQDLIYTGIRASSGISHNVFDNETGIYGIQGHFRDGTLFNFTMAPFLDVPGYEDGFSHRLFEYYLKKSVGKHHSITVGQQRTPTGYEGCMSSFGLPIGRRSQLASKYSNITAIGAKVSGDWDRIEYNLGVFDTGRFLKNNFDAPPEFAGLVSFKPIKNTQKYGKLKVGGSYNGGKLDYSYNVYSAHVAYDYKKFHNISEVAYANGYNGRSNSGAKSSGFYTTFLYDIHPKVQAFCRFDAFDANKRLAGQKNNEYTIGLHYYLKGKKARFTLSYIYADNESKPDSNRIFTMMEILL